MKYYRDPNDNNKVYAYESDGSQDHVINESFILMTEEEVYAHLNPPPSIEQRSSQLQYLVQLASSQKNALSNRISTIKDAIELEDVTEAEIAELPQRESQLVQWKRYAIYLGRVTTQEGWHLDPVWPEQPEDGMDLTVSARP